MGPMNVNPLDLIFHLNSSRNALSVEISTPFRLLQAKFSLNLNKQHELKI